MTVLGYILIPVAIITTFFPKWLYRIFVFSALFTASAIANFGEGEGASALQVSTFFGALWLARLTFEQLSTHRLIVDKRVLPHLAWLAGFISIATLSLMMPVYINGSLVIEPPILGATGDAPLYFTSHNVTQLLYLLFDIIVAAAVAHANLNDETRYETEKILLCSGLFIALWGLLQFVCNSTGIPYPYFIFNTSKSVSAMGYLETLGEGATGRVSSATLEPSFFAQSIVTLLPLTIPAWLRKGQVLSVALDRTASVIFVIALLLCTASTAYLCLAAWAFIIIIVRVKTSTLSVRRGVAYLIVGAALCAGAVGAVLVLVPGVANLANLLLINKGSTSSGLERLMTIQFAFGYFEKYPILGIGWGSATSHDLLVFLLANVGIVGAVVFIASMFYVLRTNWRRMERFQSSLEMSRSAWFQSLLIFLLASTITGFPLVSNNFWVILGVAVSTACDTSGTQLSYAGEVLENS